MLGLDQIETLIRENHLPAEITDAGQTWVRLQLTDPETGLCTTESMGFSDFANLVLHWRKHGCHRHSCSVLHMAEGDDG